VARPFREQAGQAPRLLTLGLARVQGNTAETGREVTRIHVGARAPGSGARRKGYEVVAGGLVAAVREGVPPGAVTALGRRPSRASVVLQPARPPLSSSRPRRRSTA
jgi:hypothetical protein